MDLKGNKVDKDAEKMMTELREEKIPARLEKSNYKCYEVDWVAIAGMK